MSLKLHVHLYWRPKSSFCIRALQVQSPNHKYLGEFPHDCSSDKLPRFLDSIPYFSRNECERMPVYLLIYLFICVGSKGKIWYPILHTCYTKPSYEFLKFFNFCQISGISTISGTSRCTEMGGHPWVKSLERSHHLSFP